MGPATSCPNLISLARGTTVTSLPCLRRKGWARCGRSGAAWEGGMPRRRPDLLPPFLFLGSRKKLVSHYLPTWSYLAVDDCAKLGTQNHLQPTPPAQSFHGFLLLRVLMMMMMELGCFFFLLLFIPLGALSGKSGTRWRDCHPVGIIPPSPPSPTPFPPPLKNPLGGWLFLAFPVHWKVLFEELGPPNCRRHMDIIPNLGWP